MTIFRLLFIFLIFNLGFSQSAPPIIPQVLEFENFGTHFSIESVELHGGNHAFNSYFLQQLSKKFNIQQKTSKTSTPLTFYTIDSLPEEAYKLSIKENGIAISAKNNAGFSKCRCEFVFSYYTLPILKRTDNSLKLL